jgi:two-component system response regulator
MDNYDIDILLIEDDMQEAELVSRVLKKHNLNNQLFHISDSTEALDFLLGRGKYADRHIRSGPKVILLDLNLPRLNGREFLSEIKTSDLTKHIPVVIFTSSYEDSDINATYQLGVNSYIIKPLQYNLFDKVVFNTIKYWLFLNRIDNKM